MKLLFRRTCLTLALAGAINSASAFSLLGPIDTSFMTVGAGGIGYNPRGFDIGGPMNLAEGYRWNIKTIYYGFDPSFTHYFGPKGSNAVVQALEVLNNLPPMSKVNLASFPTDTRRYNYRAASLAILDLKSFTLSIMMEEMGLASPERYVWTLRNRTPITGTPDFQYVVIQRNFDPVTIAPSLYVNDTLYYYNIREAIPVGNATFTDAVEFPVDPLQSYSAVASLVDRDRGFTFTPGLFFTGLTRDDVGGLRYLYKKGIDNSYVETIVTNAISAVGGGSPFGPGSATNVLVVGATRTGVDKFVFKLAKNESLYGPFIVFTNQNKETFFTNGHKMDQRFSRAMTQPDIVFAAGDLGITGDGFPNIINRSGNFINNAALNTTAPNGPTAGPGNISPTVFVTFSKLGPHLIGQGPSLLDQANFFDVGAVWGSFDGTTNDPIVYPQPPGEIGMTIQDLLQIIFAP